MVRSLIGWLRRLGLQRRIMLYVTGGLIAVMAAYSAVSLQAIHESTNLVLRERLMVAGTVARQVDGDISSLQGELGDVGAVVGRDMAANQPDQALQAMHNLRLDWSDYDAAHIPCAIILTDPNGKILQSDPPAAQLPSPDFASLPFFRNALGSGQPALADQFSPEGDAHGSLWLAAPILQSGKLTGVLVADLSLAQVSQSFAPLLATRNQGYGLEVVNENGIVLSSGQPVDQWKLSDHLSIIKDLLAQGQPGTATHSASPAEPTHIIAFAPLRAAPWGVTLEEPQDLALALPHALQNQLLLFGMVVLLAGLVLAWVTTRAVVKPVNALIDATQRIAAGDLDHPLDLAAEDEVGKLSHSFDEMRVELKQSRAEIARWNRELEERVQQRTRELSALVKSSHALAATLDLDSLFEIMIQETRAVLPAAEAIAFFLFDPARALLVVRSTFGFDSEEWAQVGFGIGEGIPGRVFESRSPVRLRLAQEVQAAQANLSAENHESFRRASGGRPVQSALCAPLISKGTGVGALVLYNFSQEDAFTENDVPLFQAFADQATAAIENAQLYASLQEKEAARSALLGQVIQAQEEERARVAREIHDELGQLLTRLSIDLKMSETQIASDATRAAQTLAATQTLVWQTIEQAHRLIVELRPTLLDELGLEAALREELTTRLEPQGIHTRLEAHSGPDRLPGSVEITVFRIAQEAISNIARHAHAQHASLSLHADGTLELCIRDDGVGVPADWRSAGGGHRPLGLLGMQERAALIGGSLTVEPNPPHGTCVTLRVPLDEQHPTENEK